MAHFGSRDDGVPDYHTVVKNAEKDKEKLLRLIREYGKGIANVGTTHYLQSDAKRRIGVYKEINRLVNKYI